MGKRQCPIHAQGLLFVRCLMIRRIIIRRKNVLFIVTFSDRNVREVYSKPILFTDFPEPGIRFYYADWVIHLPSEY
jgi:hypothetical protein